MIPMARLNRPLSGTGAAADSDMVKPLGEATSDRFLDCNARLILRGNCPQGSDGGPLSRSKAACAPWTGLAGLFAAVLALLVPAGAAAQPTFESAGERALGMGGAFVAVSNDATATHWNPAGLVTGDLAGMTIGWYRLHSGDREAPPFAGAGIRKGNTTSIGSWPMGVAYGRFEMTNLVDLGDGSLGVQTLRTRQAGLTVLQTLVDGIIGGATIRYVRGSVVTTGSEALTVKEALEATDSLTADARGTIDLDLGLTVDMQKLRLGVVWKNLRSPTFGDLQNGEITLPRQTRFGVALLPSPGLTLAMDIDLDRVDLAGDLRRMFALGGEGRIGRHLAVRSGLRWSLAGPKRLVGAGGLSIKVKRTLWIDGHVTQGRATEDKEFGIALRAGL